MTPRAKRNAKYLCCDGTTEIYDCIEILHGKVNIGRDNGISSDCRLPLTLRPALKNWLQCDCHLGSGNYTDGADPQVVDQVLALATYQQLHG